MNFNPLCLQHLQFTFMWDLGQKFDLYGKILNIWLKNMIILPALILDSIYIFKIRSHLHIISWVHENSFDYTLYFRINVFLFPTFIRFEIWKVISFSTLIQECILTRIWPNLSPNAILHRFLLKGSLLLLSKYVQ